MKNTVNVPQCCVLQRSVVQKIKVSMMMLWVVKNAVQMIVTLMKMHVEDSSRRLDKNVGYDDIDGDENYVHSNEGVDGDENVVETIVNFGAEGDEDVAERIGADDGKDVEGIENVDGDENVVESIVNFGAEGDEDVERIGADDGKDVESIENVDGDENVDSHESFDGDEYVDDDDEDIDSSEDEQEEEQDVSWHKEWTAENLPPSLYEPLYEGSKVTICGAHCCIMRYALTAKLPYSAIQQLLDLLQIICPSPNCLPKTLHKLKAFFKTCATSYKSSYLCSKCGTLFSGSLTAKNCQSCNTSAHIGHLVQLPLDKSLQTIVSSNWTKLQAHVPSTDVSTLNDIWSGDVFRTDSDLQFNTYLALGIYTDGVSLFKSSKSSLWPVYLIIHNLPPQLRFKSENIILGGIWQGPSKPNMSILLKPIINSVQTLKDDGIFIKTSTGIIKCHAKLKVGVFDAPAKCSVLCEKQYNGEFGCSVCLHPGKRLANGARIYLPKKYEIRTHQKVVEYGQKAARIGSSVYGVLGLSPLSTSINLVSSVPVDYMHAVLEGVTKMLMNLWFNSSNHKHSFYLGLKAPQIDHVLLKQRPPHELSRCPRSISEHLSNWKASEFENWLLFYSLPLLNQFLPPLYLHHYALLVCAMHMLLQETITVHQVEAAEIMINEFYCLLPELYGESHCTSNVHSLSHLALYVRQLGPLWTHSAFSVESKNGDLKHLYHGNGSILEQIIFNVDIAQTLQLVHPLLKQHETATVLQYLNKRGRLTNLHCCTVTVEEHSYICGKGRLCNASFEEKQILNCGEQLTKFPMFLKDNVLYYSIINSVKGKRNSSICTYLGNDDSLLFGCIQFFLLLPTPCAVIRSFPVHNNSWYKDAGPCCRPSLELYKELDLLSKLNFIVKVHDCAASPLVSVSLNRLVSKAVLVTGHSNELYVIRQPNRYDHN